MKKQICILFAAFLVSTISSQTTVAPKELGVLENLGLIDAGPDIIPFVDSLRFHNLDEIPVIVPIERFSLSDGNLVIPGIASNFKADFAYASMTYGKDTVYATCKAGKMKGSNQSKPATESVVIYAKDAFFFDHTIKFVVTRSGIFINGKKISSIMLKSSVGTPHSVILRQDSLANLLAKFDSAGTMSNRMRDSVRLFRDSMPDVITSAYVVRTYTVAVYTQVIGIQFYEMRLRDYDEKLRTGLVTEYPGWREGIHKSLADLKRNLVILGG